MTNTVSSVLLVDDDPNVRGVFELVMNHHNIELHVVHDAESALEFLQDHEAKIVVMDIFLPGMDGYQALKKLRSIDSNCEYVVVATTAYYTSDSATTIKEFGFDGFIPKPINPRNLISYLESVIA